MDIVLPKTVENMWTRDIAKLLGIDIEKALAVQDFLEMDDFDFSECTKEEFEREVKIAYDYVSYEGE